MLIQKKISQHLKNRQHVSLYNNLPFMHVCFILPIMLSMFHQPNSASGFTLTLDHACNTNYTALDVVQPVFTATRVTRTYHMSCNKTFTCCAVSQLSAGHYCIKRRPRIITDSAPGLIPAHLHTPFIDGCPTNQPNVSVPACHYRESKESDMSIQITTED